MEEKERLINNPYLTPQEVMDTLKVSRVTLWRLEKKGVLKPIRISEKILRYNPSDVERLLTQNVESQNTEKTAKKQHKHH